MVAQEWPDSPATDCFHFRRTATRGTSPAGVLRDGPGLGLYRAGPTDRADRTDADAHAESLHRTADNPFPNVPAIFRTSTVEVLYVTDRKREGDSAKSLRYGSRRSKSLAFGITTVRIGRDVSWDELVVASRTAKRHVSLPMSTTETHEVGRFPPVPTREVKRGQGSQQPRSPSRSEPARETKSDANFVESAASADSQLRADARFKALVTKRLALTSKKEVYVFIHGIGSDFEEPTYVMGGLWHFMGRCGVPVVYTWPAGGGSDPLRNYTYDRESSEFTVFHLKQFLRLLASCPDVEKVHIIAHSSGTNTALSALRELAIELSLIHI